MKWTDADKAFWILEHGEPNFAWIFERNGDTVYRRPMASPDTVLPPWISTEREEVTNKIAGRTADLIIWDEMK
jgi:hypothetical protein